jgi:hypothetical protein
MAAGMPPLAFRDIVFDRWAQTSEHDCSARPYARSRRAVHA